MTWPEFWGGPTGFDQPDPFIWWIVIPPLSYLWAIVTAWNIAQYINERNDKPDE